MSASTLPFGSPSAQLIHGDCLEVLRAMPDASVDAVVTDPPYGLGFMGKAWDDLPPGVEWATECLSVLKPGGHLLAFGGSRTWHRLACAVEDAGFEIRDSIAWLYGSGFPKSLDVSKAIDKAAGAEWEVVGSKIGLPGYHLVPGARAGDALGQGLNGHTASERLAASQVTAPATPAAVQWQGWGTALKPAFEPVVVARKPLVGTVAGNVLAYGTGALNIDAARINPGDAVPGGGGFKGGATSRHEGWTRPSHESGSANDPQCATRWPANVILDESQAAALDEQSGVSKSPTGPVKQGGTKGTKKWFLPGDVPRLTEGVGYGDTGGASRFFYVAKAPKRERPVVDGVAHPTVKPLTLMRYLVRLVTPPGGVVLDTFAGSGATLEAAALEGFDSIGIEREADYLPLIEARLARVGAV